MTRAVLVTGATGKQGGGVVRSLLARTDFEVIALTRNASSAAARKLATSLPNIKLLQGDLNDANTIFKKALQVTINPIWGVFSMQSNPDDAEKSMEESQGKNLVDEAIAANVQFFVYSSIDRGGSRSSSNPTPVPSWAIKHRVEQYLEQKATSSKMRYVVLRPTAFMTELTNDFMGKAMASLWKVVLKDKPLQLTNPSDIGWFATQAFLYPDEFASRFISIAGAEITFRQANEIFKAKFGKDIPTTFDWVGKGPSRMVKDVRVMFTWLKEEGNAADAEECRRMYPDLMDFGTWLEKESPFRTS